MLTPVKVKDLKRGEWFVLKSDLEYPKDSQVYIRGEYCRDLKKYSIGRYDDINIERFVKGDKTVFVGFTF